MVDPYDMETCKAVITEELSAEEPSVIISRRPCALLKYVKHPGPICSDSEKCRGCKACMNIGCPAISMENGKAKIDDTLCVGCGVCKQLCKFDALRREVRKLRERRRGNEDKYGNEEYHDCRRRGTGHPACQ